MASFTLKDTAPTTEEEMAIHRQLERGETVVWCPIRDYQLDVVVCARLQNDRRRRCRRVGCVNLDTATAKALRKARKAANNNGSGHHA